MLVENSTSLLISSNPSSGAQNLSSDGDSFQITLNEPLSIPKNSFNVSVSVIESNIWNTVFNVSSQLGNNTLSVKVDVGPAFTITFPDGIYSLGQLSNSMNILIKQAKPLYVEGSLSFTEDSAQSKVIIKMTQPSYQVDFINTVSYGQALLLGFNNVLVQNLTVVPYYQTASNRAQFNNINYFLIHSDLVNKGTSFNGVFNQTIAKAPIIASPNSLTNYEPQYPDEVDAQELSGASSKLRLRFWLTDDQNRPVKMSEYWGFRLVIKWTETKIVKTGDGTFL